MEIKGIQIRKDEATLPVSANSMMVCVEILGNPQKWVIELTIKFSKVTEFKTGIQESSVCFFKDLFIYLWGGGAEGEGESPADSLLSEEPDVKLDTITLKS